jgi:hypothetical protein
MKKLDKVLTTFYANYKKAKKGKMVSVTTLKRKDFKKQLSTCFGVGFQDLKKQPQELIKTLSCEGYNLHMIPVSIDYDDMTINVEVKKG